ncbi:hypothetical protein [Hyphococcus sp. DH-69]|uniref:hypothetical protein n=1 Tax=Hyphococcus formosus TaxID=3143534 RepID=UPI00398A5B63
MNYLLGASDARYDVRPEGEFRSNWGGPIGNISACVKDVSQGACAGFLSLMGATHLTGGEGLGSVSSNIGFLDQIWSSLAVNGMAGPVELLAGIALFLAARRTISRTLGLGLFIAFIAAQANGYDVSDMLKLLSNLLKSAAGALEQIPVAETTA